MPGGEEGCPETLEQALGLPLLGGLGLGLDLGLVDRGLGFGAPGGRRRLPGGGLLDRRLLGADRFGGPGQVQGPLLHPGHQLIARLLVRQPLRVLGPDPLDTEVRGLQVGIGDQQDDDPLALFDALDGIAFLVEEEGGHVHR